MHVRLIRVFVSSPSDVAEERRVLDEVVASINRTDGQAGGFRLELFRWEDNVVPQIGLKPQQVVDHQTPPYDVYLGILSTRFGTPTGGSGSGTEKEFRYAAKTWAKNGAPWITFYFDDNPRLSGKPDEVAQYLKVCEFRQEVSSKGIVAIYSGVRGSQESFYDSIAQHLRMIARRHVSSMPPTASASHPEPGSAGPSIPLEYIHWLRDECADLDLLGLRVTQGYAIRLNNIYIPLTTQLDEPYGTRRTERLPRDDKEPPSNLLLSLLDSESLYVTGAPGSGKSTFCRWVVWLSCEGNMPAPQIAPPDEYQESFPPSFHGRLPLLVRLRDFWSYLPLTAGNRELTSAELVRALGLWVDGRQLGGLSWSVVKRHLESGTVLLVLDGLDEVPLTHGEANRPCLPRALLLSGLAAALKPWISSGNRVLLTSRPYGLSEMDTRPLPLRHVPLSDLDRPRRELLVRRWFHCLLDDQDSAEHAAREMLQHVAQRAGIETLTANPMLLTAMCMIYQQGKRLPQDTYSLYDRIVDNVLFNRYPEGRESIDSVRNRLAVVAYGMHTGEWLGEQRRTPQAEATYAEIDRMIQSYQDHSPWTEPGYRDVVAAREQMLTRTGLLLPRGDDQAAFYHFTFQRQLNGTGLNGMNLVCKC